MRLILNDCYQLLYNEPIPAEFSIANQHQLPPMNVILSDKWRMFVATMSSTERNARWPGSFNTHGNVKDSDRRWGPPGCWVAQAANISRLGTMCCVVKC